MEENQGIFDGLEPDIVERLVTRREAMVRTGKISIGLALASLPLQIAAVSKSAFAQGGLPQQIIDVLNFALTLEYLEDEFYRRGVAAQGLIPSSERPSFTQISKHETAHVALLATTLGGNAVAKPSFDFTAGGAFPDPFLPQNYQTFLALAQAFEDTGVRAYKGQATELISDNAILTVALQIHSVEARHAAEVRRIRGEEAWITGNSRGTLPEATQGVYNGEDNTDQGGVTVSDTAAFDEPLSKQAVLDIAGLFIV